MCFGQAGDEIYAVWMGASRASLVLSYHEVSDGGKGDYGGDIASYSPIRTYQIKFGSK
jgi:hypothetical protein